MTRFRWALERQQTGDPPTFLGFLKMDLVDRGWLQKPYGQQVNRCLRLVPKDNVFHNVGTKQEYLDWVDLEAEEGQRLLDAQAAV